MTATLRPGTQPERVLRYFREHPGSSTWEAAVDLHIANITARMSDLRDLGYVFEAWVDDKGTDRYRVREPRPEPVVDQGETIGLGW